MPEGAQGVESRRSREEPAAIVAKIPANCGLCAERRIHALEPRRERTPAGPFCATLALCLGSPARLPLAACELSKHKAPRRRSAVSIWLRWQPSVGAARAPVPSRAVDHGELDTQAPKDASKIAATADGHHGVQAGGHRGRVGSVTSDWAALVDRDSRAHARQGLQRSVVPRVPDGLRVYGRSHDRSWTRPSCARPAADRILDKPLPYRYGFVRATSPQYLRIPNHQEQEKSEFKLDEHLTWFEQNRSVTCRKSISVRMTFRSMRAASPLPGLAAKPRLQDVTGAERERALRRPNCE